jgi:hypothetical protein
MDEFDRIEGEGERGTASDGAGLVKWLVGPVRQKVVYRGFQKTRVYDRVQEKYGLRIRRP